jgi:hypothetical protein
MGMLIVWLIWFIYKETRLWRLSSIFFLARIVIGGLKKISLCIDCSCFLVYK